MSKPPLIMCFDLRKRLKEGEKENYIDYAKIFFDFVKDEYKLFVETSDVISMNTILDKFMLNMFTVIAIVYMEKSNFPKNVFNSKKYAIRVIALFVAILLRKESIFLKFNEAMKLVHRRWKKFYH